MDLTGRGEDSERRRPSRTASSVDGGTWEYWWGLNRVEYQPTPGYGHTSGDGTGERYAEEAGAAEKAAIDMLLDALQDEHAQIRAAACRALATVRSNHRSGDQVKLLLRAMSDKNHDVRDASALALAERSVKVAAPKLRAVLASTAKHRVHRAFAALALIRLEDEDGIAKALKISQDPSDPELAGAILIGLGQSRNKRFTRHLLASLEATGGSHTKRRRVRCDAMMALGKLGNPITVGAVAQRLTDRERIVQRSAALALGGYAGNPKAALALEKHGLKSKDALTRGFAAISLARIGQPGAREILQGLVTSGTDVEKGFALLGLGLLKDRAATPVVLKALQESARKLEFGAAALASGFVGATAAEPILMGMVGKKGDPRAAAYALIGMSLSESDRDVGRLKKHLWVDSATIQMGVPVLLGRRQPVATAAWLGGLTRAATSGVRQEALVTSLAFVGGSNELPILVSKYRASSRDGTRARIGMINAVTRIVRGHEASFAQLLRTHTYYLFNNIVLDHLAVFP